MIPTSICPKHNARNEGNLYIDKTLLLTIVMRNEETPKNIALKIFIIKKDFDNLTSPSLSG